MAGTWKLGRWFGIDVYIHWTFWLLIGWILLGGVASGNSWSAALAATSGVLLAFGCVVLHEYGHSLTARAFGIPTREITLLPIGGVARLEKIPEKPWQEMLIAIAGPAVNVVILAVLALIQIFDQLVLPQVALAPQTVQLLSRANLALIAFNMLPLFPMDGGRVLRAALAMRLTYRSATRIAVVIGQTIAIGMGIFGLFYNPVLTMIAVFVFLAGRAEANQVDFRDHLRGWTVGDAMLTRFLALPAYARLEKVAANILTVAQTDFPVIHEGMLVGMLRRRDLLTAVAEGRLEATVSHLMRRKYMTVSLSMPLSDAVQEGWEQGEQFLPVVAEHRLLGMLDITSAADLVANRARLAAASHPTTWAAEPVSRP